MNQRAKRAVERIGVSGRRYRFFLGGHDLEMVTIRELLQREAPGRIHDAQLSWGASASSYASEIDCALAAGEIPVLIELNDDIGAVARGAVTIGHHGPDSGSEAATSLEQVFALLGLVADRWTRWFALVAANDRGYIPELVAAGASSEEIRHVRALDRAAQGVTSDEEAEAERAINAAENRCGGRLTIVRMRNARMAAAEDRLQRALGGPGVENLLLLSPGQADFSGEGQAVSALRQRFPGGWYGGALPHRGYWGFTGETPGIVEVLTGALS